MPWSKKNTLEFIEIYKSFKCLWSVNSPDYCNRYLREEAYQYITEHVALFDPEVNRDVILKKINSLSCAFNRELGKVRRFGKDAYQPQLFYFGKLLFLVKEADLDLVKNLPLYLTENYVQDKSRDLLFPEQGYAASDKDECSEDDCDAIQSNTVSASQIKELDTPLVKDGSIEQAGSPNPPKFEPDPEHCKLQLGNKDIEEPPNLVKFKSEPDYFRLQLGSKEIPNPSNPANCEPEAKYSRLQFQASNSGESVGACSLKRASQNSQRLDCDDYFYVFGQRIAYKMRRLENTQRIFAERLVHEILYGAELESLSREVVVTVSSNILSGHRARCDRNVKELTSQK